MLAVSPLLAVFGFLTGGTAAVGACYVLFLLGFGLYFAVVVIILARLFEHNSAIGYYVFDVAAHFSAY